ncbi:MAG: phosphoribulokinase [Thiotrichales bacterium]
MSVKHPIVAVTGSSGAGTTTVKHAFEEIFRRERISAFFIDGNSFRRFDREGMKRAVADSIARGRPISHFGPEANLFDRLESAFREYSRTGTGIYRRYVDREAAATVAQPVGTFTAWQDIPEGSDLLLYEGLHGGCTESTWSQRELGSSHNPRVVKVRHQFRERGDYGVDVAKWVDLLVGVAPAINLEWIQKIQRDSRIKGSSEAVVATILRRMPDYIKYIVPQFSLTDLNFQRMPLVDTSNPFVSRDIPALDESVIVVRFREPRKFNFPKLLDQLPESFMSRPNTLVVPGSHMGIALEVICAPLVLELLERQRAEVASL